MKKFWSIFTVALVALSAVSCSNNFEEEVVLGGETLSFNVNIDNTRTALEQGENGWNTVWVGDETLVVSDGTNSYSFKNTAENKNKFTCTAEGVRSLIGNAVNVVYNNVINSAAGAAGMTLEGAADSFSESVAIELAAGNAFVKLTSTADVTLTASADIFGNGSARLKSVTVKAGTDVLVPIYAAADVDFSASFAGVVAKQATLTFVNNKIYNLGTLEAPVASKVWGTAGEHNNWDAGNPAPMYEMGDYVVAYNLAGGKKLKFVKIGAGNSGWDGAVGGAGTTATQANVWTDTGGNDIILPSGGPYDVYLLPSFKYCVVAAGTTPVKFDSSAYDLYLKPNSNWLQANARFAAYFFGNGEKWVSMTRVGDDIYGVNIPDGYTSVIFCRMNPSATANNWGNKWNQTGDLTIPTDGKNLYTINNGSWDAGSWSTKK